MSTHYTNERNHQILIALLKAHGVRYIVASPGTTNSVFIGSVQSDPYFTIYSSVDERSAAYIACGIAHETGEAVVISCTGATAARNYMSGATEAYYSKLPILIVTSSQESNRIGHLIPQVTNRSDPPADVCKISVTMPNVRTKDDEWECNVNANKALLELLRRGGGPAHINLITTYSNNQETALTCEELPSTRAIRRVTAETDSPNITKGKTAIFVGAHQPFDEALTKVVERFCEVNNAVVLCDHTSNYCGRYKIPLALAINQAGLNQSNTPAYSVETLIHIGEVSAEEGAMRMIRSKETWRVSPDGEIRDTFRNLSYVFEMTERSFFEAYSRGSEINTAYYDECETVYRGLMSQQPDQLSRMPFSNVWIASQIAPMVPAGSTVVLSILNTIRTWNYSEFGDGVKVFCPTGGFGIDGATSMALGASLGNPDQLCFCVTGDLAFFYDLNALGNRHVAKNLRILLVNNGVGFEFKKCYAMAYRLLGDDVDPYVAAAGHFGNKSSALVRDIATDLGFEYLTANDKASFNEMKEAFVNANSDKPIILEAFVTDADESSALNIIHNRS